MTLTSIALSLLFLFGLVAEGAAAQQKSAAGAADKQPSRTKPEAPFACDRFALDSQSRKRHFDELGPALASMRVAVRELANGYEFQFSPDPKTIALVEEWAAGERACCPFFDIELRMEREHGAFWLRLTGREGTKKFTKEDFRAWM